MLQIKESKSLVSRDPSARNGPYIFINMIKVEMRLDMICLVPLGSI